MFDYLQQFKRLPKELQDCVSSPEAMASLDEIETKHGVRLAAAVMRLMVKDLTLAKLPLFLASEFSINEEEAKQVVKELENGALKKAASYLGFAPVVTVDALEEKVNNILKTGFISFSSQALIDRFKLTSRTYLHGVRSKIDTRSVMQKSIEAGGLGLSIEKTDALLNLLDGKKIPENISNNVPKKSSVLDNLIAAHTIQPEYSLANSIEERKKKLLAEKELPVGEVSAVISQPKSQPAAPHNLPFAEADKKLTKKEEIAEPDEIAAFLKKISQGQEPEKPIVEEKKENPIPVSIPKPIPTPIVAPVVPPVVPVPPVKKLAEGEVNIKINQQPKEVKPEIKTVSSAEKPVAPNNGATFKPIPTANLITPQRPTNSYGLKVAPVTASSEQGRVRMNDVVTAPRVMGPIEELRFLDLVNFRRLAPSPEEAAAKIFTKIKLLEKNGYDRMTAGIDAWRQNEVSRLYLIMCRESAFKAKPLSEIIEYLKSQGQDYLTQEEIDAIMALNAKLLF